MFQTRNRNTKSSFWLSCKS